MSDLQRLLLTGSTALLRFWFGLGAVFYGWFMLVAATPDNPTYRLPLAMMHGSVWFALFDLVGFATMWGAVTSSYSKGTMVVEGFISVAVWTALSIATAISQGSISAVSVAGLISIYLSVRYPAWR